MTIQMRKKLSLKYRCTIYLLVILSIVLGTFNASGQDESINWVTSKEETIATALSEGKYILLLAGASWCDHCYAMRYLICDSNDPYPIKDIILENYVPWFVDTDSSSEWRVYAPGPPYYIPSTSRIDPRNPDEYIDQNYGDYGYYNDTDLAKETFYNRLLSGLGDIDSDGMPDEWERDYGLDALADDASGDIDEDGASNVDEYNAETYPNDPDSDDDGMVDGWEIQYGLNPLVDDTDEDLDGDGFSNLDEYLNETLPNDAGSHPPRFMPWLPLLLEDD